MTSHPHGGIAIVLGGASGRHAEHDDGGEEATHGDEYGPEMEASAEEAIQAVKAGDAKKFVESICAIVDMHTMHEDSEPTAEKETEGEA